MKKNLILFVIIAISFVSCGKKSAIYDDTAENLYQQAIEELNKEDGFPYIFTGTNYDKLFDILKEIQLRYTFTNYAILAELRTADAYFKKEDYRQAAIEYAVFIENRPGNLELEHATYQLANCHYKLRKGKDRDPSQPKLAIKWFTEFLEKFPSSNLSESAQNKIIECRNILAEREIYIGNYYKSKGNYKGALERYKNVLAEYPETESRQEATKLIEETQKMVSES